MADRDPGIDWAARRSRVAREMQRRMVANGSTGRTDHADGPMPNDPAVYTDPARFEAEKRILFRQFPLVAGLSGDVRAPGDKLLFDAAGVPILVMRGKDGVVRAFLNMCTHRGARLVSTCDAAKRVTCPFHAWTFDLEGRLVGLPGAEGFEGIDRATRSLVPVPCAEWHGIIFVVPDANATSIDVDAHLGDFAPELAQLELARAEPVKAGQLVASTNWKFALDTYGEGYHFSTLHASTIGQTHYNDICVYDRFGRHHRISFPDKSYGRLASIPENDWPTPEYGGVHFLFPNTVFFVGSIEPGKGYVQVFRLFPGKDVGELTTEFAVYAPRGIHSEAYRAECEFAYDATAKVVQTEDYWVAAEGYRNLAHVPDGFRIVYGSNEIALQHLHRSIAEAIGMPL
jgi:phenylpropionate dioxygenase-like ring-hydroxylating dioxygenase large terminal subunit